MSKLIVQITEDPINGNPREAEMFSLRFTPDWEIEIEMDIYEKDPDSGQRFFEIAKTKEGLTESQRRDAMEKYFPKRTPAYTTKGSLVNNLGVIDQNGTVNEIDALFILTFAQFKAMLGKNESDSVLQSIKQFVGLKMQDISNRGQN